MQMPLVFSEVIQAFEAIPDRRSRLEYVIELGEGLECDESIRTEENKVRGCVSSVYMTCSTHDGLITYLGCADSLIVRGFVKVLCDGLSGHEPATVLDESAPLVEEFIARTGIDLSLVESRANTFANLYARMRQLAEACR